MDAEAAFRFVGNLGRYQLFLCLLAFIGNFIFSLQMVLMVIVGHNVTLPNENNMTSIVTDFDLYHRPEIVDLMQSLLMAGYIFGCLIFGHLSDSYGRRLPLIIGGFIASIVAFSSGFAPTWQIFAVTRFFTGVFVGGEGVVMFVIFTELVGKKYWGVIGLLYQIFFSFGVCFLGLLGYLLPKWQHICLVAGGSAFLVMVFFSAFLPESPRWLYSTGKTEAAEATLRKIAKRNGKDANAIQSINLTPISANHTTHNFTDLFRYKKLVIRLSITCILWFSSGLVYYGLTLGAADLVKDRLYVDTVLTGVIEIPATIFCVFLMEWKWFGRKRSLMALFGLCVVCSVLLIFFYDNQAANVVLQLGSKLAITGTFNIVYVYTGETFPTPLRSITIGIASTSARIGAIIAPFTSLMKSWEDFAPYLLYGVVSLISGLLLIFLPRTLGKPVPQTIEEILNEDNYKTLVNEDNEDHPDEDDEEILEA